MWTNGPVHLRTGLKIGQCLGLGWRKSSHSQRRVSACSDYASVAGDTVTQGFGQMREARRIAPGFSCTEYCVLGTRLITDRTR